MACFYFQSWSLSCIFKGNTWFIDEEVSFNHSKCVVIYSKMLLYIKIYGFFIKGTRWLQNVLVITRYSVWENYVKGRSFDSSKEEIKWTVIPEQINEASRLVVNSYWVVAKS